MCPLIIEYEAYNKTLNQSKKKNSKKSKTKISEIEIHLSKNIINAIMPGDMTSLTITPKTSIEDSSSFILPM